MKELNSHSKLIKNRANIYKTKYHYEFIQKFNDGLIETNGFEFEQGEEIDLELLNVQPLLGFNIIGEDQTNQILQVNLYPKEKVYIGGKILYANFDWNSITIKQLGYDTFWAFCKECYETGVYPLRKLHNTSKHINYFGITKSTNEKPGGKFLIIDSEVYGNDMYIHPKKIVISNVSHDNSQISRHPNIKTYINKVKKITVLKGKKRKVNKERQNIE